jgi:hypothetical protein
MTFFRNLFLFLETYSNKTLIKLEKSLDETCLDYLRNLIHRFLKRFKTHLKLCFPLNL